MQGRPNEIRALEKKMIAFQSQLNMLSEEMKDLPGEMKAIKAEIKILMENQSKKWLDGKEVMFLLGISARTLQHMRCSGELPFSVVHNRFHYKVADVDVLFESNYLKNNQNKEL